MSIRWWAYQEWTPPFDGTVNQEQKNFLGHNWKQFPVFISPRENVEETRCSDCKVLLTTEDAKYPCGTLPQPVSWEVYEKSMISLGRTEELPYPYLQTTVYKGLKQPFTKDNFWGKNFN
jgi:hypothetical protein